MRKLGQDKKGILGGFVGMFVATIVVVIILLIFVFISGIVKMISGNRQGVAIRDEGKTGISNIFSYMVKFVKLVDVRFKVEQGKQLDNAIKEAGYG